MNIETQSAARREASLFLACMNELAKAKLLRDQVEIWWALDDIAFLALGAQNAAIRNRAVRELDRHRDRYRTNGCTDRFGSLDVFWDLPPEPFPYVEPANDDDAPWPPLVVRS